MLDLAPHAAWSGGLPLTCAHEIAARQKLRSRGAARSLSLHAMRNLHVFALYGVLATACRTVVEEVPAESEPVAGSAAPEPAREEAAVSSRADGFGWSELRGDKIGTGESTPAELRKVLKVQVNDSAGYSATRAFVLRSSPTSEYLSVLVELKNESAPFQCYVQAEQIQLRTTSGELIPLQRDSTYLAGSLGQSDLVTDTCLAEGETGYLSISPMSGAGAFDALADVDFVLSASAGRFERPDYMLVPKRYIADDDHIQLTLVNEGRAKAPIDDITLIQYVLLDGEGLPLDTGFLEASTIGASVAPGGTLMADDSYYFTGVSERMKVLASY